MKRAKLSLKNLIPRSLSFFSLFFALAMLSSCQCTKTPQIEKSDIDLGEGKGAFALIFSTSVHGYVEPCGCTSQPLGGIARLATVVEAIDQQFSLGSLFIDGGDLLFDSANPKNPADLCQERARVDLLLGSLKELNLFGTFRGPFDDTMGAEYRDERLKYFGIKDLSAEARAGILQQSKDFKLGILLLDENSDPELNERARQLSMKGADVVVVISRLSRPQTRNVAEKLSNVDVVILAAVADETPSPADSLGLEGPFMVSAATQGQHLGIVSFHKGANTQSKKWRLDDRKQQRDARVALLMQRKKTLQSQLEQSKEDDRISFLKSRIGDIDAELKGLNDSQVTAAISGNVVEMKTIALTRGIASKPEYDAKLKNYEKSIPGLVAQCESSVDCPAAKPNEAKFVGAESCKSCHTAAYDVWKKAVFEVHAADEKGNASTVMSGHAKAWSTLEKKQKIEDRSCIGCHSIGFMQPGGYCKVKEVEFRTNVQCESCHGAGSLHAASGDKRLIRREVPESVCRSCHHVPHIPTTESFVYNEKVQKILGKGHGELLLERLSHETKDSTKN